MRELEISYAVDPNKTRENFVWVSDEAAEVLCDHQAEDPRRYRDALVVYLEAGEYLETGHLIKVTAFEAEDAEKIFPVTYKFGDDE